MCFGRAPVCTLAPGHAAIGERGVTATRNANTGYVLLVTLSWTLTLGVGVQTEVEVCVEVEDEVKLKVEVTLVM